MVIQHNLVSLNSHRQLGVNNTGVSKQLEKLSSGYRINSAADDAAGLAISEKMRAQITGLNRASMNAQDAVSLVQTAEGALTEIHGMLNRMVELAVESANGVYDNSDRVMIQREVEALTDEMDRISLATNFNGIDMLSGSLSSMGSVESASYPAGALFGGKINFGSAFTMDGAPREFLKKGTGEIDVIPAPDAATATGITFLVASKDGGTLSYTIELMDQIDLTNGKAYTLDLNPFGSIPIQNASSQVPDLEGYQSDIIQTVANYLNNPHMSITPSDNGLVLQVGDTSDAFNKITVYIEDMSSKGLELAGVSLATQEAASNSITHIKGAIELVSETRGNLGALQNRLEHTISNLDIMSENMTASESRIRDADMAKEMMTFTKSNILAQSSQAMLAQANAQPQQVLQLLQ